MAEEPAYEDNYDADDFEAEGDDAAGDQAEEADGNAGEQAAEEEPQMTEEEAAEEEPQMTEEEAAAFEVKMQEALELNQRLRSMVLEAEQPAQTGPPPRAPQPRPMAAPHGPSNGSPARPGVAKNGGWGGKTFTPLRANQIDHENAILVAKLSNIAAKGPKGTSCFGAPPVRAPARSSATINRSKKEMEIARENQRMAQRLASVRPTGSLTSKAAAKHAREHDRHAKNIRATPKPGSTATAPRATGPPIRPGANPRAPVAVQQVAPRY